jgi:hypothetical protein
MSESALKGESFRVESVCQGRLLSGISLHILWTLCSAVRLSNKSAVFKPADQPGAFRSANQLETRNK